MKQQAEQAIIGTAVVLTILAIWWGFIA